MTKAKKGILITICALVLPATALISVISASYQQATLVFQKKKKVQNMELMLSGLPSFITSDMITAALDDQQKYGYPASVCIAQVIKESGFGNYGPGGENGQGLSYLAYEYKNLFGIKGTGTAGSIAMQTREENNAGETYQKVDRFRVYHTYTESINDRSKVLTNVYSDLIAGVTEADKFAQLMGQRWATDSQYGERLIKIMKQYDLYRLDTMSVSDFTQGKFTGSADGMPYYYQNDYAHIYYGSSTLADCGCGPTSFAMVATYITGEQITPDLAISWCGNSYYVTNQGTSWGYFSAAAQHFELGVSVVQMSPSDSTSQAVQNALSQGKPVICSQKPGLFTKGGHFIVLSGIDSNGKISVHDPNKNNAVEKNYNTRKFDFESEINVTAKQYFLFQ